MFERAALQGSLDPLVTVPHMVTLLSPYSFEISPVGKNRTVAYRVVVERVAFELHATVATGYMAVGLRAAVVAGAMSNPDRVARLSDDLTAHGWLPDIGLTPEGFHIDARLRKVVERSETEAMDEAVCAAALISEFVLDQLVITRPYGEVRPAVLREIAEDSEDTDPWLYDPTERDRSSAVHRALENWLIGRIREAGLEPLDPAGEPYFDVAWALGDTLFVCEVKSTINSEVKQLRLATGQLLHYLALLDRSYDGQVAGVILASGPPGDELWLGLLERLDITLLWPDRWPMLEERLTGQRVSGVPH